LPLGPVEPFAEFLERRVTAVNLEELSSDGIWSRSSNC
jgi:hypothetical protein